jgi:hypothetical protein
LLLSPNRRAAAGPNLRLSSPDLAHRGGRRSGRAGLRRGAPELPPRRPPPPQLRLHASPASASTTTTPRAAGLRLHTPPTRTSVALPPCAAAGMGLRLPLSRYAVGGWSFGRAGLRRGAPELRTRRPPRAAGVAASASTPPAIVPCRVAAHRANLGVVPARLEKSAIGPCLGRQFGTTPDTARHEKAIGPHRVGPYRAGPNRARAARPVWNTIAAAPVEDRSSTCSRQVRGQKKPVSLRCACALVGRTSRPMLHGYSRGVDVSVSDTHRIRGYRYSETPF